MGDFGEKAAGAAAGTAAIGCGTLSAAFGCLVQLGAAFIGLVVLLAILRAVGCGG